MKRKFTNVFFMVAIGIATLTSFVSCKDYEADLRTENDFQNALLSNQIAELQQTLTDEIARLEGLQAECKTHCEAERTAIYNFYNTLLRTDYYKKDVLYTQAEVDEFIQKLWDAIGTPGAGETLNDKLNDAIEKAQDAQESIDELAEKLDDYVTHDELAAEVLVINGKITEAKTAAEAAQTAADNALQKAEQALADAQTAQTAAEAAQTAAETAQGTANAAKEVADAAKELAENLKPRVEALEGAVETLNTTVGQLQQDVTALGTRIEEVADTARTAFNNANDALERVETLRTEFETAKQNLEAKDAELQQAIDAKYAEVMGRCDILHDSIEAVRDEILEYYNKAIDYTDQVKEELNYRIDSLALETRERIKATNVKLSELTEVVNNAISRIDGLEDRMDDVENAVGELTDRLETLEARIDELEGLVNDLSDRLNKLITGVIVQGAYNPVYGTFATPFGVESNVLAAYYGTATTGIDEFPTATSNYFYNGIATLDAEDVAIFGDNTFEISDPDGRLFIDQDGNAGTIYLTVNSAKQQDFSGAEFQLVNTKDEESPVKLSAIQKENNWTKKFGYTTRAAADNGLYSAKATIKSDFVKAAPKINLSQSDVKSILSDLKTPRSIDFSNIASKAYKVATSDVLPAYGIKAPWTDSEGAHAVYSTYNVAATAVKPLSFAFLSDITPERIPGFDRIEDFAYGLVDRVNFSIPQFNIENLTAPTIEHITLEGIDDDLLASFKITVRIDTMINFSIPTPTVTVNLDGVDATVPGFTINYTVPEKTVYVGGIQDEAHTVVIPEYTGSVDVVEKTAVVGGTLSPTVQPIHMTTVDADGNTHIDGIHINVSRVVDMTDQVRQLYDDMQAPIANVNNMIDDMNNFLDDVNDALQELNKVNDLNQQITDAKDNIKDAIAEYLGKLENKLLPYLQPYKYLQPIMVGQAGHDFVRLSQAVSYPSQVSSTTVNLVPTTVNAEILSPAYKKWVAVTNVYRDNRNFSAKGGDAECIAARNAANAGQLNKVLDGTVRRFPVNLQRGYVYEISYQAMDFSGYVSAKKYYVKVK